MRNWLPYGVAAVCVLAAVLLLRISVPRARPKPAPPPVYVGPETEVPFASAVPARGLVRGTPPPLLHPDGGWQTLTDSTLGLSVRIPSSWRSADVTQARLLRVGPGPLDASNPAPGIEFQLDSSLARTGVPQPSLTTDAAAVQVAGMPGRQYTDAHFGYPLEATHIELRRPSGTLVISATVGPQVDLEPELREILTTLTLTP